MLRAAGERAAGALLRRVAGAPPRALASAAGGGGSKDGEDDQTGAGGGSVGGRDRGKAAAPDARRLSLLSPATTTPPPPPTSPDWRTWADSRLAGLGGAGAPEPPAAEEEAPAASEPAPAVAAPPPLPRPPARVAVVQPPPSALPSPFTGYAELGGDGDDAPPAPPPRAGARPADRARAAAGRLHPGRLFYPGQTYAPADLAPPRGAGGGAGAPGAGAGYSFARPPLPPPAATRRMADFRDARFLASLLSDTGLLPPRRRTRLSQSQHRAACRAVKLARQMALLHPLTRHARADGGWGVGEEEEGVVEAAGEGGGGGAP